MSSCFTHIFWGVLLVLLDVKLNAFDVFPDGIGHLLIANGTIRLSDDSSQFTVARKLCYFLFGFWCIAFVARGNFIVILHLATIVASGTMFWNLVGGISEFSSKRGRHDFARRAETWRLLYAVLQGFTGLVVLGGRHVDSSSAFILLAVVIILMVMVLQLVHDVKTHIAESLTAFGLSDP